MKPRSLLGLLRRTGRPNGPKPRRARRPFFEPLEDRHLLAALLYVNDDATGLDNGTSWANAYVDLQSALGAAAAGDEIWVAAGTYKPTSGTDRTISFSLKESVSLYGGFAGTETSRDQRDWTTNVTTLSGDIGAVGIETDNSYHVVYASNITSSRLDGFTITAGRADGVDPRGGGLFSMDSSLILTNLAVTGNKAYNPSPASPPPAYTLGGGMLISGGQSALTNVTFSGNSADSVNGHAAGGGLWLAREAQPTLPAAVLEEVTFIGNTTNGQGGGLWTLGNSAFSNTIFRENRASLGGGLYNFYGAPTLTNVLFDHNDADDGGGEFNWHDTSPALTNVSFTGNTASGGGGGMYNSEGSSPTMTNVAFNDNRAMSGGGGLENYYSSPTLLNVIFRGNEAPQGGGIINVSASPTLTNVAFVHNFGSGEGGAINDNPYFPGSSTLVNCLVWDNGPLPISEAEASVTYSIIEGGWAGEGNLDMDPLFVDADNGNLHLKAGSPAIDSGTPTGAPDFDLDGNPRPVDGNGDGLAQFDMGAYEYVPPVDTPGLFDPAASVFYLRNSNSTGAADETFGYGVPGAGWTELRGDWNGDGADTVGFFDPQTAVWYLRNSLSAGYADWTFGFGAPELTTGHGDGNWIPLVGDWDGNGTDTIGLFDPANCVWYLRNSLSTGYADWTFGYGSPELTTGQGDRDWLPLVGDWDADGADTIGMFDPANCVWYLRNALSTGYADETFACGDPSSTIGHGANNWAPLTGDWNGDRCDTIGFYDPAGSLFMLRDSLTTGAADVAFGYGVPGAGWRALTGCWDVGSENPEPAAQAVDQLDLADLVAQELDPFAAR